MQAQLFKKKTQNGGSFYILVSVGKNDISERIEDSNAETTKRQKIRRLSHVFKKL